MDGKEDVCVFCFIELLCGCGGFCVCFDWLIIVFFFLFLEVFIWCCIWDLFIMFFFRIRKVGSLLLVGVVLYLKFDIVVGLLEFCLVVFFYVVFFLFKLICYCISFNCVFGIMFRLCMVRLIVFLYYFLFFFCL